MIGGSPDVKYIHALTKGVFKLLPMMEEQTRGEVVYIERYLRSLRTSVHGSRETLAALWNDQDFIVAATMLDGLSDTDATEHWRSTILSICSRLNAVEARLLEVMHNGG